MCLTMPKKNSELTKQLQRLRHQKNILWVGVLLFVLVVLWILISIFTSSRTSSITAEQRELARPFIPRLESAVFDQILLRRPYDAGELRVFPIFVTSGDGLSDNPVLIDITSELQQQVATEEESSLEELPAEENIPDLD